jgi:hypothetical protein
MFDVKLQVHRSTIRDYACGAVAINVRSGEALAHALAAMAPVAAALGPAIVAAKLALAIGSGIAGIPKGS